MADRRRTNFPSVAQVAIVEHTQGCPMPIELHAFDTPNGRKISVALEEMALPYTVKIVDIRKGRQHDPEFLKISPNAKIPAIVDSDGPSGKPVSIFESGAILIYLGEKTGKFWPKSLEAKSNTLQPGSWPHPRAGPSLPDGRTRRRPSLRTGALLEGDPPAVRRDGPQIGDAGILRR